MTVSITAPSFESAGGWTYGGGVFAERSTTYARTGSYSGRSAVYRLLDYIDLGPPLVRHWHPWVYEDITQQVTGISSMVEYTLSVYALTPYASQSGFTLGVRYSAGGTVYTIDTKPHDDTSPDTWYLLSGTVRPSGPYLEIVLRTLTDDAENADGLFYAYFDDVSVSAYDSRVDSEPSSLRTTTSSDAPIRVSRYMPSILDANTGFRVPVNRTVFRDGRWISRADADRMGYREEPDLTIYPHRLHTTRRRRGPINPY